jgi:RNA polymerase-binding transcription factor DksA
MSSTLMPTPDRPHPDLIANLPLLRAHLEEHRRFRLDQLAGIAAAGNHRHADGDRPRDPADAHADTARGEVSLALEVAARQALADIDAALERIHAGRYGTCLTCRAPIPLDRLRIVPQTAHCHDCQRWKEKPR